ncbi:hypothetical protein IPL44_00930 [Candidatus Saccharibacteria bacterium]|jgi:uncharacterized membrane protein|nr:MAG: hypothetical protein IPL44_00930 [Candidatus Saccharibacteria bacterium]
MSKKSAIEGEVVERKSTTNNGSKTTKINGIVAILIVVIAIGIIAFVLKFVVGLLAVILQFVIIAAALGLVGLIIYNFVKGK